MDRRSAVVNLCSFFGLLRTVSGIAGDNNSADNLIIDRDMGGNPSDNHYRNSVQCDNIIQIRLSDSSIATHISNGVLDGSKMKFMTGCYSLVFIPLKVEKHPNNSTEGKDIYDFTIRILPESVLTEWYTIIS